MDELFPGFDDFGRDDEEEPKTQQGLLSRFAGSIARFVSTAAEQASLFAEAKGQGAESAILGGIGGGAGLAAEAAPALSQLGATVQETLPALNPIGANIFDPEIQGRQVGAVEGISDAAQALVGGGAQGLSRIDPFLSDERQALGDERLERFTGADIRDFVPTPPDLPEEAVEAGRATGRAGAELGLALAGGGAVGQGLRRLGAGVRGRGATRLGRFINQQLGRGSGIAGDAARFGPVDVAFGLNPETSGALALAEMGDDPRSQAIAARLRSSPLARAGSEAALGVGAAIPLEAGARALRGQRAASEGVSAARVAREAGEEARAQRVQDFEISEPRDIDGVPSRRFKLDIRADDGELVSVDGFARGEVLHINQIGDEGLNNVQDLAQDLRREIDTLADVEARAADDFDPSQIEFDEDGAVRFTGDDTLQFEANLLMDNIDIGISMLRDAGIDVPPSTAIRNMSPEELFEIVDSIDVRELGQDLGAKALTAVRQAKDEIAEMFPEATTLTAVRAGTTGGEAGRSVSLQLNPVESRPERFVDRLRSRENVQQQVAEESQGPLGKVLDAAATGLESTADAVGATTPEITGALGRTGLGAAGGALLGGAAAGEEGALIGAGIGAGVGAATGARFVQRATRSAREADNLTREVVEQQQARVRSMVEDPSPGKTGMGDAGDPVIAAIERSTPVDIPVNDFLRRVERQMTAPFRFGVRTRMSELVQDLVDSGQLEGKRVTNEETQRLASRFGLDMEDLRIDRSRAAESRIQMVAAFNRAQDLANAMAKTNEMIARLQASGGKAADISQLRQTSNNIDRQMNEVLRFALNEQSQLGRGLQATKIHALANATFDPDNPLPWMAEARKLSKNDLRQTDIIRLREILKSGDRKEMRNFLDEMDTRGKNRGEKIAAFIKAGLLSFISTDAVNIGSTTSYMALRRASDAPSAIVDRILATGSGERAKSFVAPGRGGLLQVKDGKIAFGEASRKALRDGRQAWREGRIDLAKYDYRRMRTGNPILDGYLKWGFERLGAEDAAMKGFAFTAGLQELAQVEALNAGLRPGTREFAEEVSNIVARQPDDLVVRAMQIAEEATFTNVSDVGRAVNAFKRGLTESGSAGALIAELGVPFVNTLVNVGSAVLQMSPVGLLQRRSREGIIGFMKKVGEARAGTLSKAEREVFRQHQRDMAEAIGRSATTGAALMTLGWHFRDMGMMTTEFPSDDKSNLFVQSNAQPFALKIGDNFQIGIENFSPAGNVIALGAQMRDIANDPDFMEEGLLDAASGAVGATWSAFLKQLSDITFLANAGTMMAAITEPDRKGKAFMENLGRMVVPTFLRKGANLVDPNIRRQDGFADAARASLPGVSQTLEPKIGPLGEERTRDPALGPLSPFRVTRLSDDPIIGELNRLGVGIPQLETEARRGVEGPERTQIERERGEQLRGRLEQILGSPSFQKMDDARKKKILEREMRSFRRRQTLRLEAQGRLPEPPDVDERDPFFQGSSADRPSDPDELFPGF